jgi:hypothetical protein
MAIHLFCRLARSLLAVAVATGLAACDVVIDDAEDLAGSSWIVTEIDGDEVPFDEIFLSFDGPDIDSASLVTHIVLEGARGVAPRCREGVTEVAMDTDGHALNFIGFDDIDLRGNQDAPCDAGLSALHDRIAAALRNNESWEATSDTLELIGTSRIHLVRAGGESD